LRYNGFLICDFRFAIAKVTLPWQSHFCRKGHSCLVHKIEFRLPQIQNADFSFLIYQFSFKAVTPVNLVSATLRQNAK
jgi:hypothetical protein